MAQSSPVSVIYTLNDERSSCIFRGIWPDEMRTQRTTGPAVSSQSRADAYWLARPP